MNVKDLLFPKPDISLDEEEKLEEERVNALKPDENGDLMEDNDYIFQNRQVYHQNGTTIQRSWTYVKGVGVMENTYMPWSIFKPMTMNFHVDLILPDDTLPNTETSWMANWYEEEGFAHPTFVDFDEAVEFIIEWRKNNLRG